MVSVTNGGVGPSTGSQQQFVPVLAQTDQNGAPTGGLFANNQQIAGSAVAGNTTGVVAPFTPIQAVALQGMVSGAASPRLTDIPYVASGLTLPGSGALTASIASGDATINGIRVIMGAVAPGFTASKDNYVDLVYNSTTYAGSYVVTPVTISAAAPAVPANALRLGFVTTGASTITSATQTGKDSLGNWMSNYLVKPCCNLYVGTNQAFSGSASAVIFGTGGGTGPLELYDNDYMHSLTTNPTRITANRRGMFQVSAGLGTANTPNNGVSAFSIYKNGIELAAQNRALFNQGTNIGVFTNAMVPMVVGDYLEVFCNPVSNNPIIERSTFTAAML